MTKKKDLRTLPGWLQYIIVLATVAIVALIAWYFGRDTPTSPWLAWFTQNLTLWGWLYVTALIIVIGQWAIRNRNKRK